MDLDLPLGASYFNYTPYSLSESPKTYAQINGRQFCSSHTVRLPALSYDLLLTLVCLTIKPQALFHQLEL